MHPGSSVVVIMSCIPKEMVKQMTINGIDELYTIIWPHIQVNEEMSRRRAPKSLITVEIMLHCLILLLSGGNYLDIMLCLYQPSYIIAAYLSALMQSSTLTNWHKFPDSIEELEDAAQVCIARLQDVIKGVLHV